MKFKYRRPEKIRNYAKQVEFINCEKRFVIVEATTKAGKTVGCIVWLFEQALKGKDGDNYWWVAPTYTTAKIAFRRMKRFINPKEFYTANESELTITLRTGATIFFKGGDNPDSLYGEDVRAAVLDEATRMKEDSWFAVFSTLTATAGLCRIIGNVKGTNNWVYKLAREAESGNKPGWAYFRITADDAVDAGVLKREVIEEAKRTLPTGIFLELYYGIPFANAADKFCYAFDEKRHVKSVAWDPKQITYLSFDFNHNPVSCNVIQWYGNSVKVIEVIQLENSNTYRMCDVILSKYPNAVFLVTGDAAGRGHSTLNPDNLNNFDVIQQKLKLSRSAMQIMTANPNLEDNQVLVNAVLEHYSVEMDPVKSSKLIDDCKFVRMSPEGKIIKENRKDPTQQADALDGFRYFINRYLYKFIKHGNN
jgi:Phage terminase large subunit.